MSKESLEHVRKLKCIIVEKALDDDLEYGTFPDLDEMVDSDDVKDRIRIASQGYGLDKLKDDADPRVRAEVAKHGYFRSQFIKDPSPLVRKSIKH